MDIKKGIETRRSVRKYTDAAVSPEHIEELVEAARLAPSARNTQSHKYYFAHKAEDLKKLTDCRAFKQDYLYTAPLIVICTADPTLYQTPTDADLTGEDYAKIDLSIAASFMVLRATELGLGTVFIALIDRPAIRKALDIPKDFIMPYVIAAGHPGESPDARPRKDKQDLLF